MNALSVALFFVLTADHVLGQNTRFRERYSWRTLTFQFPDERTRQAAINSQEYIPNNNVPLGIEIYRDRFFVTVPRWRTGIASTLNYFRITGNSSPSPTLIPYPNYEANRIRANETSYANKIVSVFRLKVDACDRLWFVDTGIVDITGSNTLVTPPRLFIFDLRTDRLIRTYTLPSSDYSATDSSFGGNMVVDVTPDTCERAFTYLPDSGYYRIVVYSYEQNQSWRIKHPFFYFDPFASTFYIGGILFLWTDGILGVTLGPLQNDGFRTLYFTSIATNNQFSVSTRFLRDRNIATNNTVLLESYRYLGTRGSNMQTTANMLHEPTGTLFYTLPNRNGIGCWNTVRNANNYSPETNFILATDNNAMIFPNDIIFDDADNIWLLSDRLPVSNARGLTDADVNFRLFSAPVRNVIRGTICEPINNGGGSNFGTDNRFGPNMPTRPNLDTVNFPPLKPQFPPKTRTLKI